MSDVTTIPGPITLTWRETQWPDLLLLCIGKIVVGSIYNHGAHPRHREKPWCGVMRSGEDDWETTDHYATKFEARVALVAAAEKALKGNA